MVRLEEIVPGVRIRGILADEFVEILVAHSYGSDASGCRPGPSPAAACKLALTVQARGIEVDSNKLRVGVTCDAQRSDGPEDDAALPHCQRAHRGLFIERYRERWSALENEGPKAV